MYRHRRRAACPAPDHRLHLENPLPGALGDLQQRHRRPAAAHRGAGGPDLRGHQHARPERRGLRARAARPADGDLHDGLFGIRRRGIQARRRGLPAQTLLVRRLQPLGSQGQFALRTASEPAVGAAGDRFGGYAPGQGVHFGESRLQGVARTHRRDHLPRKRGRIRPHAPRRRFDHHHPFPAQEHGDGPARRVVHARTPLLYRQSAGDQAYVKGRIFLSDNEYIPIGENYKEAFQAYIDKNFRNL